jgi:hypothetical protein
LRRRRAARCGGHVTARFHPGLGELPWLRHGLAVVDVGQLARGLGELARRGPQARPGARRPRVRLAAGRSGRPPAVRAPRASGGLARRAWLRTSRVGQDVLAVTLCARVYPSAVKTHEQQLHPDRAAVTPHHEQLRSALPNKITPGARGQQTQPAHVDVPPRTGEDLSAVRADSSADANLQLNDEGLVARFIPTAKLSPERDSARYVRLARFSFLILIDRFATLEP